MEVKAALRLAGLPAVGALYKSPRGLPLLEEEEIADTAAQFDAAGYLVLYSRS